MPPLLEQPVERLIAQLESGSPRRMIALAGMPGAGKSTLAAQLAREVNGSAGPNSLIALGMDGFHLPKVALRQMADPAEAFARRGAPWTFDAAALAQRLQSLREAAGRHAVGWPDFQHDIGDPIEDAHTVAPQTRLVLVEGLYLLYDADGWEAISDAFDERWYLDTPMDVAMARLVKRHQAAWGMTREAAEARIAANDRLNAEIVFGTRNRADWRLAADE